MNILSTGQNRAGSTQRVQTDDVVPPTPTTSLRLVRAAAAERAELAGHRARLVAAQVSLREKLDRIEASLGEIEDRDSLLARLAGPNDDDAALRHAVPALPRDSVEHSAFARTVLRGPAIRRAAVEVLLAHPERPEALHYRRWYELLTAADYTVRGKDPLAVFLTQLSRSPVVARGTQAGVYAVDPHAPRRLRARLSELRAELRSVASTPDAASDLAVIRARRAGITADMAKTERALEEAEAVLTPAHDPQDAAHGS